jgi:hypothetical protein
LATPRKNQESPVRSPDYKRRTKSPDWGSVNNEPSLKNKAYHIFGDETTNSQVVNIGQKRTNSVEVVDKILKIWDNEKKERNNYFYRQTTVKPHIPDDTFCKPGYITRLSSHSKKSAKMKLETGNAVSDESIMLDEDSPQSPEKRAKMDPTPLVSKSQTLHLNKNRGIFFKTQSTSLGGSNLFLRAMILASQN